MCVHIRFTHTSDTTIHTSMSMCVDVRLCIYIYISIYLYVYLCIYIYIHTYVVYKYTFIHSSLTFYHLLAQTITWHCDDASLFQQLQAPKTCKKTEFQEMFFGLYSIHQTSMLEFHEILNPIEGEA